jgi:hypothetical protein
VGREEEVGVALAVVRACLLLLLLRAGAALVRCSAAPRGARARAGHTTMGGGGGVGREGGSVSRAGCGGSALGGKGWLVDREERGEGGALCREVRGRGGGGGARRRARAGGTPTKKAGRVRSGPKHERLNSRWFCPSSLSLSLSLAAAWMCWGGWWAVDAEGEPRRHQGALRRLRSGRAPLFALSTPPLSHAGCGHTRRLALPIAPPLSRAPRPSRRQMRARACALQAAGRGGRSARRKEARAQTEKKERRERGCACSAWCVARASPAKRDAHAPSCGPCAGIRRKTHVARAPNRQIRGGTGADGPQALLTELPGARRRRGGGNEGWFACPAALFAFPERARSVYGTVVVIRSGGDVGAVLWGSCGAVCQWAGKRRGLRVVGFDVHKALSSSSSSPFVP